MRVGLGELDERGSKSPSGGRWTESVGGGGVD